MGVLFAVALLGVSLALVGTAWKTSQQRENEKELLFVGDQFRKAIGLYYERTPGALKQYPKSFEQLIKDDRYIIPQRYLRKFYRDPFTGNANWGVVTSADGGIAGIYSMSDKEPRKKANFRDIDASFDNTKHYTDWKFIYMPFQQKNTKSSVNKLN